MTMQEERKEKEEPTKWTHERAVPYKREQFDWRKVVELEDLDDEQGHE